VTVLSIFQVFATTYQILKEFVHVLLLCWNKFLHTSRIYFYLERMFMELQELGTDTNLYALVFGESVLNDAVCRNFSLPHTLYLIFFLLMLIKFSVPFYGLSFKVAISLYRWGCAFWVVFSISYSKNPILNSFTSQDYGIYQDAPFWKELFPCNSEVSWKFCWINVIRYFVVLYLYQNRFRAAYNLSCLNQIIPSHFYDCL
jgi:hypothetical protein